MSNSELEQTIDAAWENRAEIGAATGGEVRAAVDRALALLDSGAARVAAPDGNGRSIRGSRRRCCCRSASTTLC